MASHERVYKALLEYGFRHIIGPRSRGQVWAVEGDVDDGPRVDVLCMPEPDNHFYLQVRSPSACERLAGLLQDRGVCDVDVRVSDAAAADHALDRWPAATWLALLVGAMAMFAWVIVTIGSWTTN